MKSQQLILLAVALLVPLSFIAAANPADLVLQHVPTVLALVALAMAVRFLRISNASFACLIAFLLMHILGARWTYSSVPYDAWVSYLTGASLSERFDWQRNHYDRLVHFGSGILGVLPASEALQRFANMRPLGAAIMAVAVVLAAGAIYEIIEWLIAVTLSPEQAETYNGQQGDSWDPQKDLALAWLGASLAAVFIFRHRFEQPSGASLSHSPIA